MRSAQARLSGKGSRDAQTRVGTIIAAVFALLSWSEPAIWVWAVSVLWVLLFGLLNYNHVVDRVRILNGFKRRDNALVHTKLVDAVMRGLQHMSSPADAVNDPIPAKGHIALFFWRLPPRSRDPQDLVHLQTSTFSWPVSDAALELTLVHCKRRRGAIDLEDTIGGQIFGHVCHRDGGVYGRWRWICRSVRSCRQAMGEPALAG